MPDYKSPCGAVTISATLVHNQRQTDNTLTSRYEELTQLT